MRILKESYDEALRLLRENREVMDQLAEFLIEKETITGKEFMQIFRRIKGIPEPEEPQDQVDKLMQETERAMNHKEESKKSEEEAEKKPEDDFKTVLEQQTLRDLKDAENTSQKGRFSNADLSE